MVGKCLGLMCLLFVFWGQKKVSVGRAGIDPLTVLYINFSLWSRRLLSNVSRLRIECVVIPNSAVLLLFHLLMYSKPLPSCAYCRRYVLHCLLQLSQHNPSIYGV